MVFYLSQNGKKNPKEFDTFEAAVQQAKKDIAENTILEWSDEYYIYENIEQTLWSCSVNVEIYDSRTEAPIKKNNENKKQNPPKNIEQWAKKILATTF